LKSGATSVIKDTGRDFNFGETVVWHLTVEEGFMNAARLVFCVLLLVAGPAWAQAPVHFADPKLKAAVEEALWVSDPTPTEMLGLAGLYVNSKGLTSLTGLEYAANLSTLEATHNEIGDLSPLAGLSNLQTLILNTNQISDLSPLAGLSSLTNLNLHANNISDISPLGGLTNLRTLVLRVNNIGDVSALAGLTGLETLHLEDNRVSDISPLAGLGNLRELRLGYNQIGSLSPLSGLGNLGYLDVHGNRIGSIAPVAGLSRLETLIFSGNQVSDISSLCGVTTLSRLEMQNNPLNQEAYDTCIPQIRANNPGIYLTCDEHTGRLLSVWSSAGGSVVTPGEGEFTYDYGDFVRLEARAHPGFVFVRWSGDYSGTDNPTYLALDRDYRIRANFVSARDVLYVEDNRPGNPQAGGSVHSDPYEDGTPEHPFDHIQEAIEVAGQGVSIIVHPGTYRESLDLLGKSIHLKAVNPDAPGAGPCAVVEGTGAAPVVRFSGSPSPCSLTGFVLTRGKGQPAALDCDGASPAITHCLIVGNRSNDPNGAVVYCRDSRAVLTHCTIADNYGGEQGAGLVLVDSDVTMTDSILWDNRPTEILALGTSRPTIRYCDVRGWWPDYGNLKIDPLFAGRGSWVHPSDPAQILSPSDGWAVWVDGDYHLQSQAGRWDPALLTWVQDAVTSPGIDSGAPTTPIGNEPEPNGGRVNLGAYGSTGEASRSGFATGPL
jgi:hypothetical protein